jgi:hypothetical protein
MVPYMGSLPTAVPADPLIAAHPRGAGTAQAQCVSR